MSEEEVDFIRHHIQSSEDVDLFRMNPISFGEQIGWDQRRTIDLFLYATAVGLFNMEWNISCVSCGNVFKSFRHLDTVESSFHCTLCDMENVSRVDDVIHVVFTVAPKVRQIVFHSPDSLPLEQMLFDYHYSRSARTSVGEISTVGFLKDQTIFLRYLEPGESCVVGQELEAGSILVRDWSTSIAFSVFFEGIREARRFDLRIGADGLAADGLSTSRVPIETPIGTIDLPAVHAIPPSDVTLVVENSTDERKPLWVVAYPPFFVPEIVPHARWRSPLTAKMVLNNPTFRTLFRDEAPGEGEGLSVEDLTYLFTDLKNSTALYDEVGDVTAYNLVRSHFEVLAAVITANNGVVIKTVGDAVMATFVEPAHAVGAALEMVRRVGEVADGLELKVGVHRGYSVAVALNERLDYFGQNVNIAARTQQAAQASQILITGDVLSDRNVEAVLSDADLVPVQTAMKGVSENIPVYAIS